MPLDRRPDEVRAERDVRSGSEFLRGQLRAWMDHVASAGKTAELFELEMWLRAFERFFQVKNQPLSDRETRQLTLRNWSEELRLVDQVILRVAHLCSALLTEEQVDQTRFDKYVETYLKRKDDVVVDPYVENLLRQSTPEAGLTLLRDTFEDVHLQLAELGKLARIPYPAFAAVGRALYREVRRSHLLALLIDKKFKPVHDRIANPAVAALVRSMPNGLERKQAAKVFLELFRLLHYLEYADPEKVEDENLKNTILVFALITSETRLLLHYLERRVLKGLDLEQPLAQVYDAFIYCLPLELKKVLNTELLDLSVARQADSIRARVENSHGILRDCFQQSVVQLAQVIDPEIEGQQMFPDFTAKLEQSLRLRESLLLLIRAVRRFLEQRDETAALEMKDEISSFYDSNMKYLMYRDWAGFELFFIEILKCSSLAALAQIGHRFDTFLTTLLREVQKRSILHGQALPPDLAALAEAHGPA